MDQIGRLQTKRKLKRCVDVPSLCKLHEDWVGQDFLLVINVLKNLFAPTNEATKLA